MVSKRILKIHELNTLEEYFNHILLNEINGNRADVRKYINDLSRRQKQSFLNYLKSENGEDAKICINLTIETL